MGFQKMPDPWLELFLPWQAPFETSVRLGKALFEAWDIEIDQVYQSLGLITIATCPVVLKSHSPSDCPSPNGQPFDLPHSEATRWISDALSDLPRSSPAWLEGETHRRFKKPSKQRKHPPLLFQRVGASARWTSAP